MPVQIEYYDAAKKKIKSKITVDKDGEITDGPFERYDENGVLEEKGAWKHHNGRLCKGGLYER